MTLNTREVDQKFQIYSVIFPFFGGVNFGFQQIGALRKKNPLEPVAVLGGREMHRGAFPVRFKQTASEDRSRWQLRWVGLALLRATRSNRWGRRCFGWTVGIFWNRGKPVVVLGSPNIHRNGRSQKKGGRNILMFLEKTLWKIWWYFGCLLVSDWTLCFCSFDGFGRQLMIPRFGSLIEATAIWRWPWKHLHRHS